MQEIKECIRLYPHICKVNGPCNGWPKENMMHPNLTPELNAAIAKSEEDGGVWLNEVEVGTTLFVQTKNTLYTIEKREDGFYISGHDRYCPKPVNAHIHGSTFGGSMIKAGFVGVDMYLEFTTEGHPGIITTSRIQSVGELS